MAMMARIPLELVISAFVAAYLPVGLRPKWIPENCIWNAIDGLVCDDEGWRTNGRRAPFEQGSYFSPR